MIIIHGRFWQRKLHNWIEWRKKKELNLLHNSTSPFGINKRKTNEHTQSYCGLIKSLHHKNAWKFCSVISVFLGFNKKIKENCDQVQVYSFLWSPFFPLSFCLEEQIISLEYFYQTCKVFFSSHLSSLCVVALWRHSYSVDGCNGFCL